jgi:hypothetical protein
VLATRRVLAFVAVAGATALLAGSAWALSIVGGPESDLLRGTAKADQIYGRAGADWIFGRGGNDVLFGGPGDDTISGGPGSDRITCGPGSDTAIADVRDAVAPDCEVVLRSPPEPSTTSPPAPGPTSSARVQPGRYAGATQNGDFLSFEVLADASVTRFRVNAVYLACDVPPPPPPLSEESAQPDLPEVGFGVYHALDFGEARFAVDRLGSFAVNGQANGTINGSPSVYTFSFSGVLAGALAAGAIRIDESFDDGQRHTCKSGDRWWSAARFS